MRSHSGGAHIEFVLSDPSSGRPLEGRARTRKRAARSGCGERRSHRRSGLRVGVVGILPKSVDCPPEPDVDRFPVSLQSRHAGGKCHRAARVIDVARPHSGGAHIEFVLSDPYSGRPLEGRARTRQRAARYGAGEHRRPGHACIADRDRLRSSGHIQRVVGEDHVLAQQAGILGSELDGQIALPGWAQARRAGAGIRVAGALGEVGGIAEAREYQFLVADVLDCHRLRAVAAGRAHIRRSKAQRRRVRVVFLVRYVAGGIGEVEIAAAVHGHVWKKIAAGEDRALCVRSVRLQRFLYHIAGPGRVAPIILGIDGDVDVSDAIHRHAIGLIEAAGHRILFVAAVRQSQFIQRAIRVIREIDVSAPIHRHAKGLIVALADCGLAVAAVHRRQLTHDALPVPALVIGDIDVPAAIHRHVRG